MAMKKYLAAFMALASIPLHALDISTEGSAMPLLYYDGAFFFSPNGFESWLRISGPGPISYSLALKTVFTASHGPGLLLEGGARISIVEGPSFAMECYPSLTLGYVYHVLGSGGEASLGLRTSMWFHFPISPDYSFFLGLGAALEFRYTTARWIWDLAIPLTAGFRYRLE
jgi:hypothetical protein